MRKALINATTVTVDVTITHCVTLIELDSLFQIPDLVYWWSNMNYNHLHIEYLLSYWHLTKTSYGKIGIM